MENTLDIDLLTKGNKQEIRPSKGFYFWLPFIKGTFNLFFKLLFIVGIAFVWLNYYFAPEELEFKNPEDKELEEFFNQIASVINGASDNIIYICVGIVMFLHFLRWGINSIRMKVSCSKRKNTFDTHKIMGQMGGIFYTGETRLLYKNITHYTCYRPWLIHKLFGLGHVTIEAAGSSSCEIVLDYVKTPEPLYNSLSKYLQKNIFQSEEKLMHQVKPAAFSITFREVLVLLLIFGGPCIFFPPAALFFAAYAIGRFLVLNNRSYSIYKDRIVAKYGVLSKKTITIPIFNITDTLFIRTIFNRLLGHCSLTVSCQGSAKEMYLKGIKNPEEIKKVIDEIKRKQKKSDAPQEKKEAAQKTETTETQEKPVAKPSRENMIFPIDKKSLYFSNKVLCFIVPFMVFVTFVFNKVFPEGIKEFFVGISICATFVFLLVLIFNTIRCHYIYHFTRYLAENDHIIWEYKHSLFSKKIEFAADKITLVIVQQTFWERIFFKTCSIVFGSIGSSEQIIFRGVKLEESDKVLKWLGIADEEVISSINPSSDFFTYLKANVLLFGILLIFALAVSTPLVIFVLVMIAFMYCWTVVHNKYRKLCFHQTYLAQYEGILLRKKHFAHYHNIKDAHFQYYPASKDGKVTFNLAGEFAVAQQPGLTVSSTIKLPYVPQLKEHKSFMESLIKGELDKALEQQQQKQVTPETAALPGEEKPKEAVEVLKKRAHSLFAAKTSAIILAWAMAFGLAFSATGIAVLPENAELLKTISQQNWSKVLSALLSQSENVIVLGSGIAAGFVIALIPILFVWLKRYFTVYALEDDRVVVYSGILYRQEKSIQYKNVDTIHFFKGFFHNWSSSGSIVVETIGSSDSEMVMKNVAGFDEFYKLLTENAEKSLLARK